MSRIGLEIGPNALRAVLVRGGTLRTFEAAWDPEDPGPALAELADQIGTGPVAAAIDTSLLRVRQLEIPPLPLAERRRALSLESDRYFAAMEPLAFAFAGNAGLTFAVSQTRLESWIEALGVLGPVTRVEPAPVAVGRALVDAGAPDGDIIRRLDDGVEWARLRGGELIAARHLFAPPGSALELLQVPEDGFPLYLALDEEADATSEAAPIPTPDGVPLEFLAAYGTTRDPGAGWETGFVTDSLQRALTRRRMGRRVGAAAALALTTVFAIASWGAYRDRVATRIDARIAQLRIEAAPVMALEEDLAALQGSLVALERIDSSRTDVLGALRALTTVMPEDTWLRTLRVSGSDWQIQGAGSDAAALVPLLERQPMFDDVRFSAATRRVQTSTTTYDDFALAFRTTGPAQRP